MRRFKDSESGAAMVEFALIAGVLVFLVIGAAEFGFFFKDALGVSAGTRNGARVAAQAGDSSGADCFILEAAAGAIRDLNGQVIEVSIFESNEAGNVFGENRYRPPASGDVDLECDGNWFRISEGWPESSRVNEGDDRDWIGVRVTFDHDWLTGYLGFSGSIRWTDETIMYMEPDPTPELTP